MAQRSIEDLLKVPNPVLENGIWKGPKEDLPEGYFRIGERILAQFEKHPDFIGQIDGASGKKDTYESIRDRSIRCALWLKKQGVTRGDVVGFCSKNHLDSCIPLVASLFVGAIFNPWWDSSLDEELVTYFMKLTKPKVLFVEEDLAEIIIKTLEKNDHKLPVVIFGQQTGLLSFKDILKAQNEEVDKFECVDVEAEEPSMIMYTSGTTGNPKGALYSYRSLAHIISHYPSDTESQTILWFSGLCWLSGVLVTLRSFIFRTTMVVSQNLDEEGALRYFEKYKVTRLVSGPSFANRLSKTEQASTYDVSSVTLVSFVGGSVGEETIGFFNNVFKNAALCIAYGTTECGVVVSRIISSDNVTSTGKTLPNVEIKLVDTETGEIVGPNEKGEIWCKSPALMIQYLKNPAATEEVIDSEGWYHTGDLGYYDENGYIYIVERIKELIKYRNNHIAPAAIENVIQNLPEVAEVAVVAKPSFENLEVPIAFVTKVPGAQITEDEIHQAVEQNLTDKMKLRGGIRFLDKMPYTASTKIAKKELRAMAKTLAAEELK